MWDIVAAVGASMGLGYLWYSPSVFGTKWFSYHYPGKKFGDCGNIPAVALGLTFIANIGSVFILQTLARNYFGVIGVEDALRMGAFLAGFSTLLEIPHTAHSGTPLSIFAIDKGFDVTLIMLASVMLALVK